MTEPSIDERRMQRAVVQSLRGWRAAGVTHLPRPQLVESVEVSDTVSITADQVPTADDASPPSLTRPAATLLLPLTEAPPMPKAAPTSPCALSRAGRETQLQTLARKVAKCTRCQELAATRTQTVFGVGNPEARVMFIGEAPGADEDARGEPFVGKAGQLLNKIIAACGWTREEIYICNILRCRPPGNRNPSDEEAANCREYLDGQIAIVDPEYIVCWGSVAARNLLGTEESIGRLREQWFQHGRAKVLCTYHPSYLLRNPAAKKPVWEDMQRLLAAMGLKPPAG